MGLRGIKGELTSASNMYNLHSKQAMVLAICDRVVVSQTVPKVKVLSGQSLSVESKGTDSSLKLNFIISNNNFPMIFYFLRFFRRGTSHRVAGSLNVSAYSFDDTTRAFASTRIGVQSISPIREVDHDGNYVGPDFGSGCIPISETSHPSTFDYKKAKFIVLKYVWDNWGNESLVIASDQVKDMFSDNLEDVYEDLVDLKVIMTGYNPVAVEEREIRRLKKNRGNNRSVRKVTVRVPNPAVARSDVCSSLLSLKELVDESIAFDARLFVCPAPPTTDTGSAARPTANASSTTDRMDLKE